MVTKLKKHQGVVIIWKPDARRAQSNRINSKVIADPRLANMMEQVFDIR